MDAGMKITSQEDVEKALKSIGFYRLRGYSFQLYDNAAKKYVPGTKFEDIIKLYQFDQELSALVFPMISKIEVALRVRLVEALLIHGEPLVLQDSSIFKEKKRYWQNMATVASEIARSNDVFIKHNFDNHDGEVPVWAAVEVLSFGTLSKIIKNLKTGTGSSYSILASNYQYRSKKGNLVKPSQKMLASWIQGVSVLRNMCAHNSRIYNRTIHTTPEILDVDKITPPPAHNGLYQILLAMKYLRSFDEEWTVFVNAFDRVTLNADMLWESKDPNERRQALRSKIAQMLGEEPTSPLRSRVIIGEAEAVPGRCITIEAIQAALKKCNFFNT